MAFAKPQFTRGQVNRAGEILRVGIRDSDLLEYLRAIEVVSQWRACHAYPVNTFQATLRGRVKRFTPLPLVATRMKRLPSIEKKLELNPGMKLARMQDVGGLRAVLSNVSQVRRLQDIYESSEHFTHELVGVDDYITTPKSSGYRSLHLIYKYKNDLAPEYNGLCLELQFRTRLMHAWATAVETIGSFLNQALKSNEGSEEWLEFFQIVGSAFAIIERCPVLARHQHLSSGEVFSRSLASAEKLDVRRKLDAFAVAADKISSSKNKGSFHLVILDASQKSVVVESFGAERLQEAQDAYAKAEKESAESANKQVVLVRAGSIEALRKAYPNYFLDTKSFLQALTRVELRQEDQDVA